MKDFLPPESHPSNFVLVEPKRKPFQTLKKIPLCILLAPTGDHGFSRRLNQISIPLASQEIASIVIQNPFYGDRKPKNQMKSVLRNVSDIIMIGAALVGETNALFYWSEQEGRFGPYGIMVLLIFFLF